MLALPSPGGGRGMWLGRVLVDTNVWVDAYLGSRAGSRDARRFLAAAAETGTTLPYPAHVIKDVFYIVRSTLKQEARAEKGALSEGEARAIAEVAWADAASMRDNATAMGADEADV